ncbi:MAG TPA: hypothetical protein VN673_11845, partial [Clostridia bacterium]|nr:hypothetical protein [Clostridia bacterium]
VGFFPFHIEDSERFFPDHDLVACDSGVYAGKSNQARNTFNSKVTAYHIGRIWFKLLRPDLAGRIEHLRDITPENLGLDKASFVRLLSQLPARIGRAEVQSAFVQIAETERERLERMFLSHDAPAGGYAVRDVVLFGLSEMARARRCLDLLKTGDAAGLGRLMTLSHDGDRVSEKDARGQLSRACLGLNDAGFSAWANETGPGADIANRTGSYGCSLPEIDRIVDLAIQQPGVRGAQLAGAGLGGCVMVLVEREHAAGLLKTLGNAGIRAEIFRPIAGACGLELV